jgi:hypothetical protein
MPIPDPDPLPQDMPVASCLLSILPQPPLQQSQGCCLGSGQLV